MKRALCILFVICLCFTYVSCSAEGAGSDYVLMEKGSKGAAVEKLQTRLKELGFYSIGVDGDFGSGTENAIKDFEAYNDLPVAGIATPELQEFLFSDKALAVKIPDVEVTKVIYSNSECYVRIKNNLNEAITEVTVAFVPYNINGALYTYPVDAVYDIKNYDAEPFAYYYTFPISIAADASDIGMFHDRLNEYYEKNAWPRVLAFAVTHYSTVSGKEYYIAPEGMTFMTSKGTRIFPQDKTLEFIAVTQEYKDKTSPIRLGFNGYWLPYFIAPYYSFPAGRYLTEIEPNSMAEAAGLEIGDVITKIDGNSIWAPASLGNAESKIADGETVEVEYCRGNQYYTTYFALDMSSVKKTASEENAQVSGADEILKYKQLLDSGVITQEEFDSVKKRILEGK